MMGDPCIGQHSGHAYPCTNDEGLFITDADKCLSTSLPFPFSHLFQILSNPSPPPNTHTHTHTHTHSHTQLALYKYIMKQTCRPRLPSRMLHPECYFRTRGPAIEMLEAVTRALTSALVMLFTLPWHHKSYPLLRGNGNRPKRLVM